MAVSEIDLTNVTLASDDYDGIKAHKFNYNLNTTKTKKGLYKGASREHYDREDKKVCINLTFSDGAFSVVVLKALEELNNYKTFSIGKEHVERVTLDQRTEQTGKHVDTKIEFKVNKGKIVIHAYNTQQKLMIQGSKHKWFVDSYLEPLIKTKISNSITEIEDINKRIIILLDQEMTNKHDELSEIFKCDKCEFSTETAENLRKHIVDVHIIETVDYSKKTSEDLRKHNLYVHTNQVDLVALPHIPSNKEKTSVEEPEEPEDAFNCTKCTETFNCKNNFEKHMELHSYADNLSLAFHQCRVCDIQVKRNEPNIQCSQCIHIFHKKCTNKKDAKGRWKPTTWICHICTSSLSLSIGLNPEAEPFIHSEQSMRPVLPPLTGRHRKSNLNQDSPETEFLKSQIDTLKSVLSQNDEEIKKLKQSNDLKSKRITQLEAKLEEAQQFVTQQAKLSKTTTTFHTEDSESRINLLEQKYNFVLDQINSLSGKLYSNSINTSTIFACISCDFKGVTKNDLSNHISDIHSRTFTCNQCDFTSTKSSDVKEHKTKTHPIVMLNCEECKFQTQHKNQLEKHQKTMHGAPKFPCEKCNYKAIHENDLRRHTRTMHVAKTKPQHACNMCSYNAIHEYDLRRHRNTMHGIKSSCNQCEYKTESLHYLKMHIRNEHVNTRTYLA